MDITACLKGVSFKLYVYIYMQSFVVKIRKLLYCVSTRIQEYKLRKIYNMDIGTNTHISRRAILDPSVNPQGIHVGDNTWITGNVIVLAHDASRAIKCDTYIGKNCFIGCGSIILPGVVIGDEVIVGAGSIVTKNIPSRCIVAGNPAKIIKTNIHVVDGKLVENSSK